MSSKNVEATIDMGPGTHAIPVSLFRDNRLRVCAALKAIPNVADDNTFILLQGGDSINLYNTDVEYLFRQVKRSSNTYYFLSSFLIPLSPKLIRHLCKIFINLIFRLFVGAMSLLFLLLACRFSLDLTYFFIFS